MIARPRFIVGLWCALLLLALIDVAEAQTMPEGVGWQQCSTPCVLIGNGDVYQTRMWVRPYDWDTCTYGDYQMVQASVVITPFEDGGGGAYWCTSSGSSVPEPPFVWFVRKLADPDAPGGGEQPTGWQSPAFGIQALCVMGAVALFALGYRSGQSSA